jgi:hypothetical protein
MPHFPLYARENGHVGWSKDALLFSTANGEQIGRDGAFQSTGSGRARPLDAMIFASTTCGIPAQLWLLRAAQLVPSLSAHWGTRHQPRRFGTSTSRKAATMKLRGAGLR